MKRFLSVTSLLLFAALGGCRDKVAPRQPAPARTVRRSVPVVVPSVSLPAVKIPAALDFILLGGGADPLSNQVSLAQDVQLAQSLLAGRGLTLFASGSKTPLALEAPPETGAALTLREHLAALFGLPGGTATGYAPAELSIDGPATRTQVLAALKAALSPASDPLLVYATCHGERGDRPGDSSLSLWGGQPLEVDDFTDLLDRKPAPRPVRLVITSCFGGGFAELVFAGGSQARDVSRYDVCGLFAAPWDDEASGCDPNPDRRTQESYAIHFWHALLGQDRAQVVRTREIDLDANGEIGLLEAHTWARIHAASIDVPTNTSERYLRGVVGVSKRPHRRLTLDAVAAPEEVAVIRALGAELELDDEGGARDRLAKVDLTMTERAQELEQAHAAEAGAYQDLRIGLLERWPLLDHPWEERTQRLLSREGASMLQMLRDSPLSKAHALSLRNLDQASREHDSARLKRARLLRLVRAFETLRLATVLKREGGTRWDRYQRIRSCERWAPPLREPQGPGTK